MSTSLVTAARHVASTALSGTAAVLGGVSSVLGKAADAVRPARAAPAAPVQGDAAVYEMPTRAEAPTRVSPPPQEPISPALAADDAAVTTARVPETHIDELARRTAPEVISAIDDLSTDELRMLLEHEETHKRRKTVLAAIEQAAAQHVP